MVKERGEPSGYPAVFSAHINESARLGSLPKAGFPNLPVAVPTPKIGQRAGWGAEERLNEKTAEAGAKGDP